MAAIFQRGKILLRAMAAGAITVVALPLGLRAAEPPPLTPIQALGKNVFFDDSLSRPSNKQACASCHDPGRGWVLPDAGINRTTVVAPGAAPHAIGNIKTPPNAYASFSPPFAPSTVPFVPFQGGNFWDGRAEGCGATLGPCPVAPPGGHVSETITAADLPIQKQAAYAKYLGPTADQALNPFPNTVEQNIREKNVCQAVKTAKYKQLYQQAFGEAIDCGPNPKSDPAYHTSFKRLAVAVSAWQSSGEVNSFSSRRDAALAAGGHFPLAGFTQQENWGHDLFYGITSSLNPSGRNAQCSGCHNGVPKGETPDPVRGEAPHELYTDEGFHNIGVPYNREVPGLANGEKVGLSAHYPSVPGQDFRGFFRTSTLRNVAKGLDGGFVKAYAHNGWFKSLASIVHFYNTRDVLPSCDTFGIAEATEAEALAHNCWPKSEFPNQAAFVIGNLHLTSDEEAAIVAYLGTLSDQYTPKAP